MPNSSTSKLPLKTFYGSFGMDLTFGEYSVKLLAAEYNDAHEAMLLSFGKKFCTVYAEEHYKTSDYQLPVMCTLMAVKADEFSELKVTCLNIGNSSASIR